MSNLKTLAGFDVSKNFFDVCLIVDGHEQQKQFSYCKQGLEALVKWLPSKMTCVMEATGPYYLKLAFYLHQQGFSVSVVNPLVIRRFCQMRLVRAKTDRADAKMIALYGIAEQPDSWTPPAAYMLKLQQLDALLQQLQKQHSALRCQFEAFSASGSMDQDVQSFLKNAIAHLQKQTARITQKMESIIEEHHQQMLSNLTSIPGIGRKTAIVLILLYNGFKKFESYKQLSAYVGLSPRLYESGSSVKGKSRICKMGMSRVRALLYMCTWSAKKSNNACKALYDRLVAAGKSKRLALIAVANKLIKQAFAIATNNSTFKQNFENNICF